MINTNSRKVLVAFFQAVTPMCVIQTEVFHIKCIVILCTKRRGSDCHKRGRYGKLVVCLSTDAGFIHLDCVFLAALEIMRFLWGICNRRDKKTTSKCTSIIITYIITIKNVKRESDRCLCGLTVAVSIVSNSYGVAEEAGGPAEVAGTKISHVVIATDRLLRQHGYWTRCSAAHDAVSTVGLVSHTGVSSWTHHIGA